MAEVNIYAELSKKQYNKVASGEYSIVVPQGVTMSNTKGYRGLSFHCENKDIAVMLEDALAADDINYTVIDGEEDNENK